MGRRGRCRYYLLCISVDLDVLFIIFSYILLIQEGLSEDTEDTCTSVVLGLLGSTVLLHLEHLQFLLGLCGGVGNGRVDQWSKSGR
jgi:hypothetical protein